MMNENSIKISEPERESVYDCSIDTQLTFYVHPSCMWIGLTAEAGIGKMQSRHSLAVCSG